jgi:hypothetical protein
VRGDEQAEYVIGARAGQQMVITIQAQPPGSVVVTVTDPDGDKVVLKRRGTDRWSATLNEEEIISSSSRSRSPIELLLDTG